MSQPTTKVQIDGHPYDAASLDFTAARGVLRDAWQTDGQVITINVERAKPVYIAKIEAWRDALILSDIEVPGLGRFTVKPDTGSDINGTLSMAEQLAKDTPEAPPFETEWSLYDDTPIVLNLQQLAQLGIAIGQRKSAAFPEARQYKARIASATTIEELDGILAEIGLSIS